MSLRARSMLTMKDCESLNIYVPCGHCPECIAARQNALVQRVEMESRTHHLFFATLTYDNAHIPRLTVQVPKVRLQKAEDAPEENINGLLPLFSTTDLDQELSEAEIASMDAQNDELEHRLEDAVADSRRSYDELCALLEDITPTDPDRACFSPDEEVAGAEYEPIEFLYADIHDVQLLLKNLRDNLPKSSVFGDRDLKYIAVSELGKMNGRPHFHILFAVEKKPQDLDVTSRGFGRVSRAQMYSLEKCLWDAVFKYWAHNVGTRKNPQYEKLFTYRKRFFGNRCFTNFDLHYVDPSRTKEGTRNVAYYVTKYILKGSEKERRRQQFLRLNLEEDEYRQAWDTIKCKCTISKGLGLDARFETVEHSEPIYVGPRPDEYAHLLTSIVEDSDDLPADDCLVIPTRSYKVTKRRLMIPNFDVVMELRKNLSIDKGKKPGPIFITSNGKHVPLAPYYQRFGYLFTSSDALDIWFNYDDSSDIPSRDLLKEEKDKRYAQHEKRVAQSERNSSFDTSPALLWGSDSSDNNTYHHTF